MPQLAPESSVLGRITSLLDEINSEKRASELGTSGSASKDPGGYQGSSSHPSAKADANTQSSPMGSRAHENEKDVKEDHPGAGVDHVSPGSGGDQDSHQFNIGTNQSATGEDASVEDDYKGDKDDPGTSHPANADDVGEKYSSMRYDSLTKMAFARMNEVLADIANGVYLHQIGGQPQNKQAAARHHQQTDEAALAAQAGYEMANAVGQAGNADDGDMEKLAFVQQLAEQTILDAESDADLVGDYLQKYASERHELLKQANLPPEMGGGELPPDAGGGPPPEMMGGGGGPPPDMGGGGDMPPEMMGGGGPPPDGGGGLGGGGGPGDHEQAINELANALIEAGIPPEEIMKALKEATEGGGAGGGGGDLGAALGGGGGMPVGGPEEGGEGGEKKSSARRQRLDPHTIAQLTKLAHDTRNWMRSGRLRLKEAAPGTRQRQERDEIINYVREVCAR